MTGTVTPDQDLPRSDLDQLVDESPVFASLRPEARQFVCDRLEAEHLPGGTVLLHQGDPADCLYLIAVGRLRVTVTRSDGAESLVAELGRGEIVGEMALITNEPRSATVTALRDSQVLRLSIQAFDELVDAHPDAFRQISTHVVRRLVRSFREGSPSSPVVTVAVVPLSDAPEVDDFGDRLHASFQRLTGAANHVTASAATTLGALDRVSADRLSAWLAARESGFSVVTYGADPEPTPWTAACIRQADMVLLVGSGREPPTVRPVEPFIADRRGSLKIRTELALVHPPTTRVPHGTRHWLAARDLDEHHHVRADRQADTDRVARLILGRGIGLVLSGGGARGIAELGVLRALDEHGIPLDACGGASIGSLIAGGVARGLTLDELTAQLRAGVVESSPFDVTLPLVSLAAGKRVTEHIRNAAIGVDIEDCWRRFFCVSANLTTGDIEVHRSGSGWQAVRASFSIPGVFPPMRSPRGDLLVDGGVLDNLPVGVMRGEHQGITVIAVDVGKTRDLVAGALPGSGVVSGWRQLVGRIEPGAQSDAASLGRILMRLTELGSERTDDRGDLTVTPRVDSFSISDFKAFDRLVELGYEAGNDTVDEWLASGHAPAF